MIRYESLSGVPSAAVSNVRNGMYFVSETIRWLGKHPQNPFDAAEMRLLVAYKTSLDQATKFIPTWVKMAVAIALGLGAMVGWRRIVITVGERIGKTHLTYAQGATAQLVAMSTIRRRRHGAGAAARLGLLTLPVAMLLSRGLYALFRAIF